MTSVTNSLILTNAPTNSLTNAQPLLIPQATSSAVFTSHFPNGTPDAPLFPKGSIRLLLAELLWQAGVIDEECLGQEPFLQRDIPFLIDEELKRFDDLLDEEVTLTDRYGNVDVWEKVKLGKLFELFSQQGEFEGGIVFYFLGPSYFLRYLAELKVEIPPDPLIIKYLEQITAFPEDIDASFVYSENLSFESMNELAQAKVALYSEQCGKDDAAWIEKNGFAKIVRTHPKNQEHLLLFGLRGRFSQGGRPCHLDFSYKAGSERLHMFQSDSLRIGINNNRRPTVSRDVAKGVAKDVARGEKGHQALLDRLLGITRVDLPHTCNRYVWFMKMVKDTLGNVFLRMTKDERQGESEEILLNKVLKSEDFERYGGLFIRDQLLVKWENHLGADVRKLLPLTYHACLSLSSQVSDELCTHVWKSISPKFLVDDQTPPMLFLMHHLIESVKLSFQKARSAVRDLVGADGTLERDVTKFFASNHQQQFLFAFLHFGASVAPQMVLQLIRQHIDTVEVEELLDVLVKIRVDTLPQARLLLAKVTSLCLERRHPVRRKKQDLSLLLQQVLSLAEIAEFRLGVQLLVHFAAKSDIALSVLKGVWEALLVQAQVHPQGGLYAALEVCRHGRYPFDPDCGYLQKLLEPIRAQREDTRGMEPSHVCEFQIELLWHHVEANELPQAIALLKLLPPVETLELQSALRDVLCSCIERQLAVANLDIAASFLRLDVVKRLCHSHYGSWLVSISQGYTAINRMTQGLANELLGSLLECLVDAGNGKEIILQVIAILTNGRRWRDFPTLGIRNCLVQGTKRLFSPLAEKHFSECMLALYRLYRDYRIEIVEDALQPFKVRPCLVALLCEGNEKILSWLQQRALLELEECSTFVLEGVASQLRKQNASSCSFLPAMLEARRRSSQAMPDIDVFLAYLLIQSQELSYVIEGLKMLSHPSQENDPYRDKALTSLRSFLEKSEEINDALETALLAFLQDPIAPMSSSRDEIDCLRTIFLLNYVHKTGGADSEVEEKISALTFVLNFSSRFPVTGSDQECKLLSRYFDICVSFITSHQRRDLFLHFQQKGIEAVHGSYYEKASLGADGAFVIEWEKNLQDYRLPATYFTPKTSYQIFTPEVAARLCSYVQMPYKKLLEAFSFKQSHKYDIAKLIGGHLVHLRSIRYIEEQVPGQVEEFLELLDRLVYSITPEKSFEDSDDYRAFAEDLATFVDSFNIKFYNMRPHFVKKLAEYTLFLRMRTTQHLICPKEIELGMIPKVVEKMVACGPYGVWRALELMDATQEILRQCKKEREFMQCYELICPYLAEYPYYAVSSDGVKRSRAQPLFVLIYDMITRHGTPTKTFWMPIITAVTETVERFCRGESGKSLWKAAILLDWHKGVFIEFGCFDKLVQCFELLLSKIPGEEGQQISLEQFPIAARMIEEGAFSALCRLWSKLYKLDVWDAIVTIEYSSTTLIQYVRDIVKNTLGMAVSKYPASSRHLACLFGINWDLFKNDSQKRCALL